MLLQILVLIIQKLDICYKYNILSQMEVSIMKETAFIHFLCLLIPLIIFPVSIFILQQKYKESFPNAIYKACLMFFLLPISFYLYIYILKNSIFSNPSMWIISIFAYVYLYLPKNLHLNFTISL